MDQKKKKTAKTQKLTWFFLIKHYISSIAEVLFFRGDDKVKGQGQAVPLVMSTDYLSKHKLASTGQSRKLTAA